MKLFFRATRRSKRSLAYQEFTGEFEAPDNTDLTDEKTRKHLRRYIRKHFKVKSTNITICKTI